MRMGVGKRKQGERGGVTELRVRTVGKGAAEGSRERGKPEKVKRKLRAR